MDLGGSFIIFMELPHDSTDGKFVFPYEVIPE
jgi:hypothetical protein